MLMAKPALKWSLSPGSRQSRVEIAPKPRTSAELDAHNSPAWTHATSGAASER